MNLAQMLDKIYKRHGLPDANNPTTAFLIDALDDAEREVVRLTHCVRTANVFNSTDNTPSYSLSTYVPNLVDYHIDAVYYSTTDSTER